MTVKRKADVETLKAGDEQARPRRDRRHIHLKEIYWCTTHMVTGLTASCLASYTVFLDPGVRVLLSIRKWLWSTRA
jgi:hypothetical protein